MIFQTSKNLVFQIKIMKSSVFIFLLILSLTCFTGCKKNDLDVIVFDNSEPLALAVDVEWAVIAEPYAAYKESHSWQASVKGHGRKGDVLQVIGKYLDKNSEVWYCFENGWLPSSVITIYNNRYKAKSAADRLLKGN